MTESSEMQTCVDEQFTIQQLDSDAMRAITMTTSTCRPLTFFLSESLTAPVPIFGRSLKREKKKESETC
jgi:hypothetical protein